ncbi:hypothetical protein HZA75_03225 [Candidatus Roizmanbacteria bacterium]|nr:hypothetical protein [Candidatus Roizmanbacteria bacterium]
MLNTIIKYLIIAVLFLTFIVLFRYLSKHQATADNWEFVGYQYKWNSDYVYNSGLKSESDCLDYGDRWLKKQESPEALYTCSTDCEPYGGSTQLEVCKKVCEYDRKGLVQCRK